jgi:hypothetical protein
VKRGVVDQSREDVRINEERARRMKKSENLQLKQER